MNAVETVPAGTCSRGLVSFGKSQSFGRLLFSSTFEAYPGRLATTTCSGPSGLCFAHPDHHAVAVYIRDPESGGFPRAKPGRVDNHQHDLLFKRYGRIEDLTDVTGEHVGGFCLDGNRSTTPMTSFIEEPEAL